MDEAFLYQQIAEALRREILQGILKPGDRLPSVRQMTVRWNCTLGTVQRAYQELSRQKLIVSRGGQGTRVASELPRLQLSPLQRASLVNRAENFILEAIGSGYTVSEVEQALLMALDRWRTESVLPTVKPHRTLRFCGSHDLAMDWVAAHFSDHFEGDTMQVSFAGSLGGLISLAEGKADLAGCHLWDAESNSYNRPFVQRLLPGQRIALVTLAFRRLGLILRRGSPQTILQVADLARPGVKFVNRQPGSGTRVWLDLKLQEFGIRPSQIDGYADEKLTHSAVAQEIASGQASVGLGLEAAALAFDLEFVFLTNEQYHLVISETMIESFSLESLIDWLKSEEVRQAIEHLGGYDTTHSGEIEWIE